MQLFIILVNLAIVLLFLVFLARFLERFWRKYQSEQAAKPKEKATTDAGPIASVPPRWRERLRAIVQPVQTPPTQEETVKRFRDWATRDLDKEPDLQSWLVTLPEPGVALLIQHLVSFCQELNFELAWLLEDQVTIAPELRNAVRGAVIDYCRACRTAVPVQKQAKLFIQYQQLLKNPDNKAQQALSRTLYANLTSQGLAPTPDATFIVATEAERQQQALQVIQQTATQNWPKFAQVLHTTLTPNGVALPSRNGHAANGAAPAINKAPQGSQQPEKIAA